jgi:hypothetical protein
MDWLKLKDLATLALSAYVTNRRRAAQETNIRFISGPPLHAPG